MTCTTELPMDIEQRLTSLRDAFRAAEEAAGSFHDPVAATLMGHCVALAAALQGDSSMAFQEAIARFSSYARSYAAPVTEEPIAEGGYDGQDPPF